QEKNEIESCRKKYQIPETYILFVGTSDPRKNIQTIVRSMAYLPASVKLVCTGWAGWDRSFGQDAKLAKNRVLLTGYVSDRELACLYSGARAFVYPSVYEGFGLPVLEAMACGCPVVCANRASLPEVAGDAALYCAPDDPECFRDRINKLCSDVGLCEKMRKKSIAQAEKFSWAKTAEKTIKVFYHIAHL
ncbi:MAG: glycosyltransferase family 1 protein, partial [Desulfobacterales bacterium]